MSPSCFLVLSAPSVMAFLDILPMTRGHLLVTVRGHREKIHDLTGGEGGEVGEFFFFLIFSTFVLGIFDVVLLRVGCEVGTGKMERGWRSTWE